MSSSKLSVGIVGLPNVGKSTLFNALLKKQVADAANYPFCTIEPNVGVVEVPDDRLQKLASIVETNTIIPAAVEFYDIAGLVRGASAGEGLGNKFLSHIREVAVIAHVVRFFEDGQVVHVGGAINPADDIATIDTELILADLETVLKQKEPRGNASKEQIKTYHIVQKIKTALDNGLWAQSADVTQEEFSHISHLNLLTMKPVIYVCNVSENQLAHPENLLQQITTILPKNAPFILLNAKLETEILTLSAEDQKEYLAQYHLEESGLNRLIRLSYHTLQLRSFLTAGKKEVRAWTIKEGTKAPQAAGVIHTDFEKHFIKAEVLSFDLFIKHHGWTGAREAGAVTLAGRDYIMKEGDVVDFKVGI